MIRQARTPSSTVALLNILQAASPFGSRQLIKVLKLSPRLHT